MKPRDLARLLNDHPGMLTAAAVLAIGGAVGGVTQLLVPLELHRAGFSASATGSRSRPPPAPTSWSARSWSGWVTAPPRFAPRPSPAWDLPCRSCPARSKPARAQLIGMLLLTTVPRAVVSTVSYPLATESAATAGLGAGLVIGLLNGTWATGLVLAPLLAGALDQAAGPSAAYLVAIVPGALGALWLIRQAAPAPAPLPPGDRGRRGSDVLSRVTPDRGGTHERGSTHDRAGAPRAGRAWLPHPRRQRARRLHLGPRLGSRPRRPRRLDEGVDVRLRGDHRRARDPRRVRWRGPDRRAPAPRGVADPHRGDARPPRRRQRCPLSPAALDRDRRKWRSRCKPCRTRGRCLSHPMCPASPRPPS